MFDSHRLWLFFTAALVLALTPGPGILYVLARSLAGGRRDGVVSSLGTFAGGLVHVFAAAAGVSAVLAASALAFSLVKYAGAAYLAYLGVRMIRSRNDADAIGPEVAAPRTHAFRQGVITEVLNPKTALFFLSFIPQFIAPERGHVFLQFLILGVCSVGLNTSVDLLVALLSGPLGRKLKESAPFRRRQRVASGFAMIGLGAWVAASDAE